MLIENLPDDSATGRALSGATGAEWTTTDHLLAGIYDTLRVANWQRGGGKGRRPKPIPRPGDNEPQVITGGSYSVDELRAILDEQNPDVSHPARS